MKKFIISEADIADVISFMNRGSILSAKEVLKNLKELKEPKKNIPHGEQIDLQPLHSVEGHEGTSEQKIAESISEPLAGKDPEAVMPINGNTSSGSVLCSHCGKNPAVDKITGYCQECFDKEIKEKQFGGKKDDL